MTSALGPDSAPPPTPIKNSWWTGRRRASAAIGIALGIGYCSYQPVDQMGFLGDKPLEVYKLTQSHEIVLDAPSQRTVRTEQLVVGYWSNHSDREREILYARKVAPYFIPTALRLGITTLLIQPSQPVLFRRFPVGIKSTNIRYSLDPTRSIWVEEYRKGDSAKIVSGPAIAVDDSVARTLLFKVCTRDSTGFRLIAPSARESFGAWDGLQPLGNAMPKNCSPSIALLTISVTTDSSSGRRLAYLLHSSADSSFASVSIASEGGNRMANTIEVEKIR